MRIFLLVLLAVPFVTVAQKNDSTKMDTVALTSFQEARLIELENAINELKKKQIELIEFIFDSKGVQLNTVIDFKYEKGRLIYITKLK